jgi:DNA-binding GntR family transcriptional regulator
MSPKIVLKQLHEQVAQNINEMIRKGELRRGQKINETRLCELMGVSRTPIREALRTLNTQGIIDLVPHKGAFVSQFSIQEINDMFEVMSMLEGMCARLAVKKMAAADLKKIERLHEKLEHHYRKKDHKSYLEINEILHVLLQKLTGNKTLNEVANGLRQKILLFRHKQLYEPERFDRSIQEHRDLLDAFRKKDSRLAEKVMKKHLIQQCKALVGLYTKDESDSEMKQS